MINNSRSIAIIDPSKYTDNINVIGVGATGSRIVKDLIELGFTGSQIHVYDFDIVEEHNVNNQIYSMNDIGKPKVVAMSELILRDYGEKINVHNIEVTKNTLLRGVVFLLTDGMASRKELTEGMRYNPNVSIVIETRLDPRCGYVHTFSPLNTSQYKFFLETLFDDEEAVEVVSACGSRQTIGHVVDILSGMAMCEFVKFVNEKKIGMQLFFSVDPYFIQEKMM